jgi:2-(1,2-epoxy-1,2-dihydrophenyl)acetyl-CoA isomerase
MADERELIVERQEGLAILRLNRPERLNALSPGILQRMAARSPIAVRTRGARDPDHRRGQGPFASAAMSTAWRARPIATHLAGMKASHAWLKSLWAGEKIVITAVNGAAAGAGFGLALIGDLILASDAAVSEADSRASAPPRITAWLSPCRAPLAPSGRRRFCSPTAASARARRWSWVS